MSLPIEEIRDLLISMNCNPVYLGVISKGQPDTGVWVASTGGAAPFYLIGSECKKGLFSSYIQILVRGCANDYEAPLRTARNIMHEVVNKTTKSLFRILLHNSEPLYLGADKNDRHLFTVNITTNSTE